MAVAGARGSGKAKLIALLEAPRGRPRLLKARLLGRVRDAGLERLRAAKFVEIPGYTASPEGENARDRATRRDAVEEAVEANLLILVVRPARSHARPTSPSPRPGTAGSSSTPASRSPRRSSSSPASSAPSWAGRHPPYDWRGARSSRGRRPRPDRAPPCRLPPTIAEFVAVGLGPPPRMA